MFYFDEISGKKILRSTLIKDAQAFFTTRETFLKTKDENLENIVQENKKIITSYLNIDENSLVFPEQTHSANVEFVLKNKNKYPQTDGLILTDKNMAIFLNFADCTPIIFYDSIQNIGAVSHAGWRGTAQKIAPLTVEKMVNDCNSKVDNITVLIGPAISSCCYNVGEDVYKQLISTVANSDGVYEYKNKNIFVNLKEINKRQLNDIGVYNVDVCPYCTVCDNKYFFSYRKESATTNRHNAVLKLT